MAGDMYDLDDLVFDHQFEPPEAPEPEIAVPEQQDSVHVTDSSRKLAGLPHWTTASGNSAKYLRLWDACRDGRKSLVEALLGEHFLDPSLVSTGQDGKPVSALINAVQSQDLDTVLAVLRHLNPHAINRYNGCALLSACAGKSEIVQVLVASGADPIKAIAKDGSNVLHKASQNSSYHQVLLPFLLQLPGISSILVNSRTVFQSTPLHIAWSNKYATAISSLLENGADPTLEDKLRTPAIPILYGDQGQWIYTILTNTIEAEHEMTHDMRSAVDHWQKSLRATVTDSIPSLIPDLISIVLDYLDPNRKLDLSRAPPSSAVNPNPQQPAMRFLDPASAKAQSVDWRLIDGQSDDDGNADDTTE